MSRRLYMSLCLLAAGLCACGTDAGAEAVDELLDGKADGNWGKHDNPPWDCPRFDNGKTVGRLEHEDITEASGLVVSRRRRDVLWTHNDSGDTARVFALDVDGSHRAMYLLHGVSAVDIEDLAIGPGPVHDEPYIYLADTGDNDWEKRKARSHVVIYRFMEPHLHADTRVERIYGIEALALEFPDGPRNVETLLVDPQRGDIVLVSKSSNGKSTIYSIEASSARWVAPSRLEDAPPQTLKASLTLHFGKGGERPIKDAKDPRVTGGDVSSNGREILIRTYSDAFVWLRPSGTALTKAFRARPCQVELEKDEAQGEAIAFDHWGSGYYSVSEERGAKISHYARR